MSAHTFRRNPVENAEAVIADFVKHVQMHRTPPQELLDATARVLESIKRFEIHRTLTGVEAATIGKFQCTKYVTGDAGAMFGREIVKHAHLVIHDPAHVFDRDAREVGTSFALYDALVKFSFSSLFVTNLR